MKTTTSNNLMKSDATNFLGEFPADPCARKHLIFFYKNIIEYQYVGDGKASLIRVKI